MSEDESADPENRAFKAIEEFAEAIDAAKYNGVGERIAVESQAFKKLTCKLEECYAAGLNVPVGLFAEEVADRSRLTKTVAKQGIAERNQQSAASGERWTPLNEWVRDNLEEVRVVRTTDHIQDTRYVWDFGDETFETTSGSEGQEHYAWSLFRDAIKDQMSIGLMPVANPDSFPSFPSPGLRVGNKKNARRHSDSYPCSLRSLRSVSGAVRVRARLSYYYTHTQKAGNEGNKWDSRRAVPRFFCSPPSERWWGTEGNKRENRQTSVGTPQGNSGVNT